MKYIVKVGDRHVIECNGTNYEVEEKGDSFQCGGVTVYKNELQVSTTYSKAHLTTIVLVVQMAQLIQEQG